MTYRAKDTKKGHFKFIRKKKSSNFISLLMAGMLILLMMHRREEWSKIFLLCVCKKAEQYVCIPGDDKSTFYSLSNKFTTDIFIST